MEIEKFHMDIQEKINFFNGRFSLIYIDIDFFIRYCVRLEAAECSKIMHNIHKFLWEEFSDFHIIRRADEDEFVVICKGKAAQETMNITKEALKRFRCQRFAGFLGGAYEHVRMTFSAGVISYPENGGKDVLLKKALVAMHMAKSFRRNNVQQYIEKKKKCPQRILYNKNVTIKTVLGKQGRYGCIPGRVNLNDICFSEPQALAMAEDGAIYIADQNNHQIICCRDQTALPVAMGLNKPTGLCIMGNTLYISDTGNDQIIKLDLKTKEQGIAAGTGMAGNLGDCGLAVCACLNKPGSVAVDKNNNIYFCDIANNVIRKIDCEGIITNFAGTGEFGFSGDGQKATMATFNELYNICIDAARSNLYIADYFNHRIRRVDLIENKITTVVGCGRKGYEGDGGSPLQACLSRPTAVCADLYGNLYIAESGNQSIRIVVKKENKIYTLAGGCGFGKFPDMLTYQFANPNALCVHNNYLYILDSANNRVCAINLDEVLSLKA